MCTNVLEHVVGHPDMEGEAWPGVVVEGVQEQHLCLHHGPARVEAGAGVPEVQLQVKQILRPFLDIVMLAENVFIISNVQ